MGHLSLQGPEVSTVSASFGLGLSREPSRSVGIRAQHLMAGSGLAPFLPARALETPGPGGQQRLGQGRCSAAHRAILPGLTGQRDSGQGPERTAAEGRASLPADALAPHLCGAPVSCLCPLSLSTAPSAAWREEVSLGPVSNGRAG